MAAVDAFVAAPSEGLLEGCTLDQLVTLADRYGVDLGGLADRRKGTVKARVVSQLVEKGVLPAKVEAPGRLSPPPLVPVGPASSLSFEQQRELLLLQIAHDEKKLQLELDQQLTVERICRDMEQAKLDLQSASLGLVREGRLSGDFLPGEGRSPRLSDLGGNLRLVPKFNERDPDVFFSMFERVAETRAWSDAEQVLLLQSVLTGKAQEAYASLCGDSLTYAAVKAAILKAFELVPEAYRQRFRTWERRASQSHMEFARELSTHFERWCGSSDVSGFESLCNLIVLEQFKNSLPSGVATYLTERKVTTASEAAELADEYVLIHRKRPGEPANERVPKDWGGPSSFGLGGFSGKGSRGPPVRYDNVCNYCREVGHWKPDCLLLRSKAQQSGGAP